jgi:GxxExxY protein
LTVEQLNVVSKQVLDAAFRVHTELGPGLLESASTSCLVYEISKSGLALATEVAVPIVYNGVKLTDVGYRMDILVVGEVVVEVKSLEAIAPVHLSQLVSYLKLSNRRLGLLLNFNVVSLRDGIYRRVNGL